MIFQTNVNLFKRYNTPKLLSVTNICISNKANKFAWSLKTKIYIDIFPIS